MATTISTFRPAVASAFPPARGAVAARLDLVRAVGNVVRCLFGAELAQHRARHGLAALDPHVLRDIGLS